MKAIVVGGGIMGLSTAWGLARAGHDVELFEQGPLPNPLASSMDEHRLIRHPYGDHAGYARMIDDAYAAWDLMWADLGRCLYAATGTLALTGNGETWAARSAATLAAAGKPMTELKVADLRAASACSTQGVERAFWIDTGGVLFAQDIVAALARHLAQLPPCACVPIRPCARSISSRVAWSPGPGSSTAPTSSWSPPARGSPACCRRWQVAWSPRARPSFISICPTINARCGRRAR
jgi:glycine/D-amino acid oxidase-like deaminating enzyme